VRSQGKTISARAVLAEIRRARAARSIPVEGGPTLIAAFYAEGLLDEEFLTISPQIASRGIPDERVSLVMGRTFAPERPLWERSPTCGAARTARSCAIRFPERIAARRC
jgi:dihydrofolate reductase